MNQAIKARWLDKLRSGEYTQGFGYLQNDNTFCCLGVLCEIAVQDRVVSSGPDREPDDGVWQYDWLCCSPPAVVMQWAGLEDNAVEKLVELNDGDKKSFGEIADYIEEKL